MRCSSAISLPVNTVNPTSAITDEPCSGRGDCLNGTCLCEIRYSGDECDNFNLPYHAGKCALTAVRVSSQLFSFSYYCADRIRIYIFGGDNDNNNIIGLFSFLRRNRCLICILLRGGPVARTTLDMLCGRISTTEAAIAATCAAVDDTKVAVLCCFHRGTITRCILHDTGKCILKEWTYTNTSDFSEMQSHADCRAFSSLSVNAGRSRSYDDWSPGP